MSVSQEVFNFVDWVEQTGLSNKAADLLVKVNIVSLDILESLELAELKGLKLDIGDWGILRREWRKTQSSLDIVHPDPAIPVGSGPVTGEENKKPPLPPPSGEPGAGGTNSTNSGPTGSGATGPTPTGKPSTRTLASEGNLDELIDNICSSGFKDVLGLQSCEDQPKGERAYPLCLIPDFVSHDSCIDEQQKDEFIAEGARGSKIYVKSDKKRLSLREISCAQWIGANSRIFAKLLPFFSNTELSDYCDYVEQVSEFFQQYPSYHVLRCDDLHRRDVHATGRRWCDVKLLYQLHFLRFGGFKQQKPFAAKTGYDDANSFDNARNFTDNSRFFDNGNKGRPTCKQFNSYSGCHFSPCKYKHSCLACGTIGHPAYIHHSNYGSWQNQHWQFQNNPGYYNQSSNYNQSNATQGLNPNARPFAPKVNQQQFFRGQFQPNFQPGASFGDGAGKGYMGQGAR